MREGEHHKHGKGRVARKRVKGNQERKEESKWRLKGVMRTSAHLGILELLRCISFTFVLLQHLADMIKLGESKMKVSGLS